MNVKTLSLLSYLETKSQEFDKDNAPKLKTKKKLLEKEQEVEGKLEEVRIQKHALEEQIEGLGKDIQAVRQEIADMVMEDLPEEQLNQKVKEKKGQLLELTSNQNKVTSELQTLMNVRDRLQKELEKIQKELVGVQDTYNHFKKALEVVQSASENSSFHRYLVSDFDQVMTSLAELFATYGRELSYNVEVVVEDDNSFYLTGLEFSYKEPERIGETPTVRKLKLNIATINSDQQDDYCRGCHMGVNYYYRAAFNFTQVREIYDFFHFLPKTFIHTEFNYCLSEEMDYLTSLFIYQPDNVGEESFIRFYTSDQEYGDDDKKVLHKIYTQFSEYPTTNL